MASWEGQKVLNAEKDIQRSDRIHANDEAVYSKLKSAGIEVARRSYKRYLYEDDNEIGEVKVPVKTKMSLNGREWPKLKKSHLFERQQTSIKQRVTREVCYHLQESKGLYRFGTVTLAQGVCSPSAVKKYVSELRKQFRAFCRRAKKYGLELLVSFVHYNFSIDEKGKLIAKPHIHFVWRERKRLDREKVIELQSLLSEIGKSELGHMVKSKEAVLRYSLRVETYAEYTAKQLATLYRSTKGIKTYMYHNSMNLRRLEFDSKKVSPRWDKESQKYELFKLRVIEKDEDDVPEPDTIQITGSIHTEEGAAQVKEYVEAQVFDSKREFLVVPKPRAEFKPIIENNIIVGHESVESDYSNITFEIQTVKVSYELLSLDLSIDNHEQKETAAGSSEGDIDKYKKKDYMHLFQPSIPPSLPPSMVNIAKIRQQITKIDRELLPIIERERSVSAISGRTVDMRSSNDVRKQKRIENELGYLQSRLRVEIENLTGLPA